MYVIWRVTLRAVAGRGATSASLPTSGTGTSASSPRLLIAVGRAAPLSVAWLPLAGFLLPSSPLPQVAEAVGAGEVIGGSWSSILFSLDVAVGLWPLLREGLRSSRLRPGALTRPCAS